MNTDMLIKSADSSEIKILLRKWKEKCKWLDDRGLVTWNAASFTEENLQKQYIAPHYFSCYLHDQLCGGFILLTKDRFFWPDKTEDDSFYIHKLMVCNGFNGKGYGKLIINWIKEYGKQNGKKYIRLDYFKNKQGLARFYAENGFCKTDEVSFQDRGVIIKAECQL